MSEPKRPKQVIMVADQEVVLPPGVSVAEWGLEKTRLQNPRIRSLVGSLGLLDNILESNYALLHCSPERLGFIWRTAQKVAGLMRDELLNLLEASSKIPDLAEICDHSSASLRMLRKNVLDDLEQDIEGRKGVQLLKLRKILCVSIGQMYNFLQDTLGAVLANDPRSQHEADYFLSRRFPRDIEEADWLFYTVARLGDYLGTLGPFREERLTPALQKMRRTGRLVEDDDWVPVNEFLDELNDVLTPKLREILALRGIRFDEMEVFDHHAFEIPACAREAQRLWAFYQEIAGPITKALLHGGTLKGSAKVQHVDATLDAIADRMVARLTEIDNALRDLVTFVPLWLAGIQKRRTLFLSSSERDKVPQGPPG